MREKLKAELLNCRSSRILVLIAEMIVGIVINVADTVVSVAQQNNTVPLAKEVKWILVGSAELVVVVMT